MPPLFPRRPRFVASETRVAILHLLSCFVWHFLVCLVIKLGFVLAGNLSWWQHLPNCQGNFGPPGLGQAVRQWAATCHCRVQSQPDWATFHYTGTFYLVFVLAFIKYDLCITCFSQFVTEEIRRTKVPLMCYLHSLQHKMQRATKLE